MAVVENRALDLVGRQHAWGFGPVLQLHELSLWPVVGRGFGLLDDVPAHLKASHLVLLLKKLLHCKRAIGDIFVFELR